MPPIKACRWLSFSYICSKATLLPHSAPLSFCFFLHYNCSNSLVHLQCWCKICKLLISVVTGHGHGEWLGLDEKKKNIDQGLNSSAVRRESFKRVQTRPVQRYKKLEVLDTCRANLTIKREENKDKLYNQSLLIINVLSWLWGRSKTDNKKVRKDCVPG